MTPRVLNTLNIKLSRCKVLFMFPPPFLGGSFPSSWLCFNLTKEWKNSRCHYDELQLFPRRDFIASIPIDPLGDSRRFFVCGKLNNLGLLMKIFSICIFFGKTLFRKGVDWKERKFLAWFSSSLKGLKHIKAVSYEHFRRKIHARYSHINKWNNVIGFFYRCSNN